MTSGALLERDGDRRRIRDVLDAARDGAGGVVVVSAAAGMGKTKLLESAIEDAREAGTRVLVARASELERDFAFGVVRELFEAAVVAADEVSRATLLSGAARQAAAVFDLDPDAPLDREVHATLHGLYWLMVNLAADEPLLVAVDDLQWADDPSLRWLAYAARRLERLPVTVLTTARLGSQGGPIELPKDATDVTRDTADELTGRAVRIEPAPLTVAGVTELLSAQLTRTPDAAFAAGCREQTGGNPFLLSELVSEIAAEDIAPYSANLPRLAHVVPERVGETIRRHLGRLGPDARALAASLAVLSDGDDIGVAAALAELDIMRATTAATELVAAQILADAPEPRFRHPLLRAAVRAQTTTFELAARHGRAARLLSERGAPSARVATHLLAGAPAGAAWAVRELRAAARAARSQGVPEQAAALLRRALAEPPEADKRAEVLRELGAAELALLSDDAIDHLGEALALVTDPAERADITISLAFACYHAGRHPEGVDVLLAAIETARDEPALREEWLRLEALLGLVGRYNLETEERTRGRVVALAESLEGTTAAERQVLSIAMTERPGPNAEGLHDATVMWERAAAERQWPDPAEGFGLVGMYLHAGRPDAARAYVAGLMETTRAAASPTRYAIALAVRSMLASDVGDLSVAHADLEAAMALWRDIGEQRLPRPNAGQLAALVVALGGPDADRRADEILSSFGVAGELPELMPFNVTLFWRGSMRLSQRRFEDAANDFRELGRRHATWNITRPTPAWRAGLALSLIGLGRPDEARPLAAEELELTRVWNTPKSIALATHALAMADSGDAAIDGMTEAVRLLEGTDWRLDRARVRCDLGAALRRAGRRRDAREALSRAMDEAHACGAATLAEHAAEELRASGARPRRRAISGRDALTESELRVATLAADGRTNREIAQELFVTPATVETHLSRTYRKLGVAGRRQLVGTLDAP